VPTKIVLKVDFLERDFERKKATGQKWAKKYTVHFGKKVLPLNQHLESEWHHRHREYHKDFGELMIRDGLLHDHNLLELLK
jgi:hypothetical protein